MQMLPSRPMTTVTGMPINLFRHITNIGGGQVVSGPELAIEGLPDVEDEEESLGQLIRKTVSGTLRSIPPKRRTDTELVSVALQGAVRGEVNAYWGKKPNVTVFVHGV